MTLSDTWQTIIEIAPFLQWYMDFAFWDAVKIFMEISKYKSPVHKKPLVVFLYYLNEMDLNK